MNRERLDHLITVLEGVKAANKAFNLSAWMGQAQDDKRTVGDIAETCGTACCAMGYAALDPLFREQGLHIDAKIRSYKPGTPFMSDSEPVTLDSIAAFNTMLKKVNDESYIIADVKFDQYYGFVAAAEFFSITENAADYLFQPDEYEGGDYRPITPDEVIERVHEVIAHNGDVPDGWVSLADLNDDGDDDYDMDDDYDLDDDEDNDDEEEF